MWPEYAVNREIMPKAYAKLVVNILVAHHMEHGSMTTEYLLALLGLLSIFAIALGFILWADKRDKKEMLNRK